MARVGWGPATPLALTLARPRLVRLRISISSSSVGLRASISILEGSRQKKEAAGAA